MGRPTAGALVVAALAWAAFVGGWSDAVLALPFDDAFYYFEIGHRLANGEGSTFDGLHATNGYHPLWQAVCAAVHLGLPADLATARALLILQLPLVFGGIALAVRGVRPAGHAIDGVAAAVVLGIWLAVPAVVRTGLNGLESAVVILVQGGLLGLLGLRGTDLSSWPVSVGFGLGGLLAAALLARTDGALLTPIVLGAALLAALRGGDRQRSVLSLVPVGLPPTLGLAAFLGLNQAYFDTPMQVSGTLKRVSPGASGIAILVGCGLVVALLAWRAPRVDSEAFPRTSSWIRHTWPHLAFQVVLVGYYTGLQTFARQWYFAPTFLWASAALVAVVRDLAARARADHPERSPGRAVAPLIALLAAPMVVAAGWTGWGIVRPDMLAVRRADAAAAIWIDEHLPADALVGSWDAGLVGYLAARPVVNLDGVVNDVAWLRALRSGTAGQRLREDGIDWVVNHGHLDQGRCRSIDEALAGIGAPPVAEVAKRWTYTWRGRLNGGPLGVHEMATCVARLADD